MIGKTKSTRDPSDPLMRSLVRNSRPRYQAPRRVTCARGVVRELAFVGQTQTVMFACGKCGLAYSGNNYIGGGPARIEAARLAAERCCNPKCLECGRVLSLKYHTECEECKNRRYARDRLRWLKRQQVELPQDGVPVYAEGVGNEFFADMDELYEWCLDEDSEAVLPAWVHPCSERQAFKLDADDMFERMSEELPECFDGETPEMGTALVAFVDTFNAAQSRMVWEIEPIVWVLNEAAFRAACDVDERGLPDLRWNYRPQLPEGRAVPNRSAV
jgi:hypothetical protein